MTKDLREFFHGDPVGLNLIKEAASEFESSRLGRGIVHRLRKETIRLAEDFLNSYLTKPLDQRSIDEARSELEKLRI